MPEPFRKILGVNFYVSDLEGLLERLPSAGLVVAPSAPVMVRLEDDPAHREAMEGADLAITDSSVMVYLWLAKSGERLTRISGLRLLRAVFDGEAFRGKGDTFWVMPTASDRDANLAWLNARGFSAGTDDTVVAPLFPASGALEDKALLAAVASRRPKVVFIALSGGVQERLGWYLRRNLDYKPTILCIGGAIAFLSGRQVGIPVWADRLGLGWILRLLTNPGPFLRKVAGTERLAALLFRNGSRSVATEEAR